MGYDRMDAGRRRSRSGQAMAEFAIAVLAIVLVVAAIVEFLPVFLDNVELLKEVREEAGRAAISSDAGTHAADRKDEFGFDVTGVFDSDRFTGGHLAEGIRLPAANLLKDAQVSIPAIPGVEETMRCPNADGTSVFVSGASPMDPGDALARAKAAMSGAGWNLHEIGSDDSALFTMGDADAPSAVAAVHSGFAVNPADESVQTCVTVIARTAGASFTP